MDITYYKARNNLIQMFTDRGYQHPNGMDSLYISFAEFRPLYESDTMDLKGITTNSTPPIPVYVRIVKETANEFKDIWSKDHNLLEPLQEDFEIEISKEDRTLDKLLPKIMDKVHLVLVYSAPRKKDGHFETKLESQKLFLDPQVEVFPVHRLTFNPTKHRLTPKHTLLTPGERRQVYDKFQTNPNMMKKICIDDPINRYYNGIPGDMYRIESNGYKPSYRVVVLRQLPKQKPK